MSTSAVTKKQQSAAASKSQNRSKLVPFLRKLQILCSSCPANVARWSADGKQFDVLDPKGFEELLKVHFEGAAPATFHRQLFFYGWVKLNPSNGGGDEKTKGTFSFRHPCFLRDEPSKIYEIKRYARASERDEQEEGSRVDVLERRVSALQSVVDDLSRKLAEVQLSLERAPIALPPSPSTSMEDSLVIAAVNRKRVKDFEDDDMLSDVRLSEDELVHLFDSQGLPEEELVGAPRLVDTESKPDSIMSEDEDMAVEKEEEEEQHQEQEGQQGIKAQESGEEDGQEEKAAGGAAALNTEDTTKFLSMCLNTPQFRAAMNASANNSQLCEESSKKQVDSLKLSSSQLGEVF